LRSQPRRSPPSAWKGKPREASWAGSSSLRSWGERSGEWGVRAVAGLERHL
jgi:hypothetical protein